MKAVLAAAVSAMILAGCGQKQEDQSAPASPVATPVPLPKAPYTKTEWRAAFKSTFEESEVKTDNDGITEYSACFQKKEDGKCDVFAWGKRDAFRKIDHLTPPMTKWNNGGREASHVGAYIAAVECDSPSLLIAPTVNGKNGWLFMEKVAFMADGEVVLERSFEHNRVDRDNGASWIREQATFIPNDVELNAVRKFAQADSQIIRITGQKGYTTLSKERTADFAKDARISLVILDNLDKALKENGGPLCAPSAPTETKS